MPGFNYEFDNKGYPIYDPQNCVICKPVFRGIIHHSENTTVTDKKDCYYKSDLDGLQDIINANNNLSGAAPLNIGHQTWEGGRIITLALPNNNITALPENIGKLASLQILHLDNNLLQLIPESIGLLESLKALGFDNNELISINSYDKLIKYRQFY